MFHSCGAASWAPLLFLSMLRRHARTAMRRLGRLALGAIDPALGLAVGDPAQAHADDRQEGSEDDRGDHQRLAPGALDGGECEQENAHDRNEIALSLEGVRILHHAVTNDERAFWINRARCEPPAPSTERRPRPLRPASEPGRRRRRWPRS